VSAADLSQHPLPAIAIAGPTACGKTAGALALAAMLGQHGQAVGV